VPVPIPFRERLRFLASYAFRKLVALWWEVRRPRLRIFLYELGYSTRKLLAPCKSWPEPFGIAYLDTRFGTFRIRPRTSDLAVVSPAYERRDVDRMLREIQDRLALGRRVLFVDIGADLGTYTIAVGNRFRESGGLSIVAVEPSASSHALLVENLGANGLSDRVMAVRAALLDREGIDLRLLQNDAVPGSRQVSRGEEGEGERLVSTTLDALLAPHADRVDTLILKVDVEGVESEVLRGATRTIEGAGETIVLVEDFVNDGIEQELRRLGVVFVTRLTPYNSWWQRES
jgi:FkbM family methyltransferase